MVDRVELIHTVAPHARFSAANGVKFNGHLNKALVMILADLPLEAARSLALRDRAELETALIDVLTFDDLKRVAKGWEPKRMVESSETQTDLTDKLVALLRRDRDPYIPPTIGLKDARALNGGSKTDLVRTLSVIAPTSDLKKLARKWDPHRTLPQTASRAALVSALNALIDGTIQPTPKRPRVRK